MVASKYMAPNKVTKAAVFGAGHVAEYQLLGLGTAYPDLETIYLWDINPERAEKVKDKWNKKINPEVVLAETPKQAVSESQIINTATSAREPVFDAEDIKPGTHINAIGAITPTTREIPGDVVVRSKIVSQSKDQLLNEGGDVLIPIREGKITEEAVYAELYEIVSGKKPGRDNPEELSLFKSIGYAMEDVVVLKIAYEIAKKKNLGVEIEI
jgi:ornithine cyclodeaminase/alanine dehydrogenase-like protein (mu-crystallin family)